MNTLANVDNKSILFHLGLTGGILTIIGSSLETLGWIMLTGISYEYETNLLEEIRFIGLPVLTIVVVGVLLLFLKLKNKVLENICSAIAIILSVYFFTSLLL